MYVGERKFSLFLQMTSRHHVTWNRARSHWTTHEIVVCPDRKWRSELRQDVGIADSRTHLSSVPCCHRWVRVITIATADQMGCRKTRINGVSIAFRLPVWTRGNRSCLAARLSTTIVCPALLGRGAGRFADRLAGRWTNSHMYFVWAFAVRRGFGRHFCGVGQRCHLRGRVYIDAYVNIKPADRDINSFSEWFSDIIASEGVQSVLTFSIVHHLGELHPWRTSLRKLLYWLCWF